MRLLSNSIKFLLAISLIAAIPYFVLVGAKAKDILFVAYLVAGSYVLFFLPFFWVQSKIKNVQKNNQLALLFVLFLTLALTYISVAFIFGNVIYGMDGPESIMALMFGIIIAIPATILWVAFFAMFKKSSNLAPQDQTNLQQNLKIIKSEKNWADVLLRLMSIFVAFVAVVAILLPGWSSYIGSYLLTATFSLPAALILIYFSNTRKRSSLVYFAAYLLLIVSFFVFLLVEKKRAQEPLSPTKPVQEEKRRRSAVTNSDLGIEYVYGPDWTSLYSDELETYGIVSEYGSALIVNRDSNYKDCRFDDCVPNVDASDLMISRETDKYDSDINKYLSKDNGGYKNQITSYQIGGGPGYKVVALCDGIGCNIPSWYIFKEGYLFKFETGTVYYDEFERIVKSVEFFGI